MERVCLVPDHLSQNESSFIIQSVHQTRRGDHEQRIYFERHRRYRPGLERAFRRDRHRGRVLGPLSTPPAARQAGFEGQGPEHSSARLERFLTLAAEDNIMVMNLTTPGQLFHGLRRHVMRKIRKPLVVMTPKSLLRHPKVVSSVEELATGTFQPIIPDHDVQPDKVTKVVFSSGKLYYELLEEREAQGADHVALVRIEQLYPLDDLAIKTEVAKYPNAEKHIWAQEEPANMGAWTYMLWQMHIQLTLVSPAPSAAPASGSHRVAHIRQRETIERVFSI